MRVGARNLGPPLTPQDILIWLRLLLQLDDDEILEAYAATGAEKLALAWSELSSEEIDAMMAEAAQVTRSRLTAWRRRHREMTWLELRALLVGLRSTTL